MFEEDEKLAPVSYEELLRLLSEENDPKKGGRKKSSSSDSKFVDNFVRRCGIAEGNIRVPNYIIYYAYIIWAPPNWARKMGNTGFFRLFNKKFKQVRSGKQRYYMLNEAFDLSKEYKDKAKAYHKNWVKGYGKKELKK